MRACSSRRICNDVSKPYLPERMPGISAETTMLTEGVASMHKLLKLMRTSRLMSMLADAVGIDINAGVDL